MKTKLDKALTDIEMRFQDMSKGGGAVAPSTGMTSSSSSGTSPSRQSGTLAPNDMGGDVAAGSPATADAPLTNPVETTPLLIRMRRLPSLRRLSRIWAR